MQKKYITFRKNYLLLIVLLVLLMPSSMIITNADPIINKPPIILDSSINPTKVRPGDLLTVSLSTIDLYGISKIEAKFFHEKGFDTVYLSKFSGSKFNGVWQGSWKVHDTLAKEYNTHITAFSASGLSSTINLMWEDPIPWWDLNWDYRKMITFDSGQVPSTQTNIPICIIITDTDLRDKAQSDGDDIAFTDSSGNKLKHEIEDYTSSTGNLVAWVNITSLTSTIDTEIYMYYANTGCSSQESSADVWSDYSMVYHLNEPTGTTGAGSVNDSTGGTSGTPSGGLSFGQTGKIGNATDFSSGTGINCGTLGSSILTADTTISFWIYANSYSSPSRQNPFDHSYGGWGTMTIEPSSAISWFFGSNGGDNSPYAAHQSGSLMANGQWIWVTAVRDDTSKTYAWYKNGEYFTGTGYSASYPNIQSQVFTIGDGYVSPVNGKIDEFRIAKSPRTANWIETQYNNVMNATDGGFYTVGLEEIAIPTAPTLSYPSDNSSTNDTTPEFQWTLGENAVNYTFLLDDENDLDDGDDHINISLSGSASSYTVDASNSLSEGRWYWKLIANNSQGINATDVWCFIVDITPPLSVNLSSPANNTGTDSNSVTFSWNSTFDNTTNTSIISNISHYNLQIDDDIDFSSLLINDNTSNNSTLSLTETVTGQVYWRVRAMDDAGNNGSFSATRSLTVFSYSISSSETTLQIKKGTTGTSTVNVSLVFGDIENVSLSNYWSGDNTPSGITVSFSTEEAPVSFDSIVTIDCGASATTGSYTCVINGTSDSGIERSVSIDITVYSMLFSLDVYPRSISLIRDDSATATASVSFDQGTLNTVYLTGEWIDGTPSGVSARYSTSSGTPNFDSTITFSTSTTATAGSYVYRITGTSAGLSKVANIYLDISNNMTLTVGTDESSYERGQSIQIYGTAKDPNDNNVGTGTATIELSATNWSHTLTTSISSGTYSTNYYITFDKPVGTWTISVTATDSKGHLTASAQTTSITVASPENYEHYYIDVSSPTAGQVYDRGDTITLSISLYDGDDQKIQGADVKACFSSGEEVIFSEGSGGKYSESYDLGYDFPVGNINVYVEGKKDDDEKLKVGFNYINFVVRAVEPTLEVIEPKPGQLFETEETIAIKIKATYPDKSPVQEGVITAIGPDGEELIFIRTEEPGVYIASYTPSENNIGSWTIQIQIEDGYGNIAISQGVEVEVVHSKIMTLLQRYWWATVAGICLISAFAAYIIFIKLRGNKLIKLRNEILKFEKLKKRNAILYFSEGKISRETYDRLSQDYESKIANFSRKYRVLEKKVKKEKKWKIKKGEENKFNKKA